jgi:hypothetical protein
MRLIKVCFWPKFGAILQKNGGIREIILHFFLRFSGFLGFFQLQALVFEPLAPIQPLQKKSYQKHYRRFFVPSAMCHNRRMNRRIVQWEMGREKPGAQSSSTFVLSDFLRLVAAAPSSILRPFLLPRACCNSARPNCSQYKPVKVSKSEYNQIKNFEMNRQGKKWRRKNRLLPSFCPHFSAYTVEKASRLKAVRDQRRDAAATFSVLRAVNFEP